jgi:hypothetical protein
MSEKLIVLFSDRCGLEAGIVLHAEGEHFKKLFAYEYDEAEFPICEICETTPGGYRIMLWEGERRHGEMWDADDDPFFLGAWRVATALDLIDADLLIGPPQQLVQSGT